MLGVVTMQGFGGSLIQLWCCAKKVNMSSGKSANAALQAMSGGAAWSVVCLCAAWCGVCRQYEPEFQALQEKFPQVRFGWVDVEDSEALMGDVDVETFPTLLIADGERAMFLGPLLPQVKVLERLLQSLMDGQPASSSLPSEASALWQRIAAQSQ